MAGVLNTCYDNFYLSNEIEDAFNSRLDLQQFCTADNALELVPGFKRKINVYRATDSVETLGIGQGNTKATSVDFVTKEYNILLAQGRFKYHDEEGMIDPMVVETGVTHLAVDMFNEVNKAVYAEFKKATRILPVQLFDFSAFADAQALLNAEDLEGMEIFAFVHPNDVAAVRKALKDDLKYVEAFSRQGYIGTVAGVNIYTKKDADAGNIYMATREAVTVFNKQGTTVEQSTDGNRSADDANVRLNTIFSRKYYVAALTNETKCIRITKTATFAASADTTVDTDKTYYKADGLGYVAVIPEGTENPATEGWFEITEG